MSINEQPQEYQGVMVDPDPLQWHEGIELLNVAHSIEYGSMLGDAKTLQMAKMRKLLENAKHHILAKSDASILTDVAALLNDMADTSYIQGKIDFYPDDDYPEAKLN